jgi:transaldolase
MTMPPKVAGEFLGMNVGVEKIRDRTGMEYSLGFDDKLDPEAVRLNTLWAVDDKLVSCVNALENENLDAFTPDDLYEFFKGHNCADVLVRWDDSQIGTSYKEGKIPRLVNWKEALESKAIGLDSLMNLAGLNSFRKDQDAMDDRVKKLLDQSKK